MRVTLIYHRVPEDVRGRHNEIAGYLIHVMGVIFAVILAFLAVAMWESARLAHHRGRSRGHPRFRACHTRRHHRA